MSKSDSTKFDKISYQNAYNKKKYDRLNIMVPKGFRDELKSRASNIGVSLNSYVLSALTAFHSDNDA